MAYKIFALDERRQVTVYKRRSSRNLRLTITPKGEIKVSIPVWAPYAAGLQFAKARYDWISRHGPAPGGQLRDNQPIGKAHHLRFVVDDRAAQPRSRVLATEITVTHSSELSAADQTVQQLAEAASIRALRRQAEELLPQRLAALADRHNFHYRGLRVKRLTSRWGSCDHQQNIVLNLFLMQLPWELIDYVILHELVHTTVLRHGPDFWQALERVLPNCKQLRRQIRQYQPILHSPAPSAMA